MLETDRTKLVLHEIQENRNHSWFREVVRDNYLAGKVFEKLERRVVYKDFVKEFPELDIIVFKYLVDNCITKAKYVYESFQLARMLRAYGINKGNEFAIFMDRTPEYTYLLGAANIVAAKINVVCEKFAIDYIRDVILKNCTSKVVFIQDNKLQVLEEMIKSLPDYTFIVIPVLESAIEQYSYEKYIKKFYPVDASKWNEIINNYSNIITYACAYDKRKKYEGKVEEKSDLDTIFTVSYSSGTTGNPKGIVHSNRHYITMARYHDSEISGLPDMGNLSTYSNIPSYSNSFILSAISDNLIKGGLVMLDPVDVSEYFPIGLRINRGNLNFGSSASWNKLALDYFHKPEYKEYRIEDAIFNFAVGEGYGVGEEYMGNKFLRSAHAGRRIKTAKDKEIRLPVGIAMMSVAGGECELGSIFVRIHRALFSRITRRKNKNEPVGMTTYDFVDVKVLREDGTYAEPYEIGRMTVLSNCNMQYYNHDSDSTEDFYITDAYGIKRADMKDYGYVDENGCVTIKDRIRDSLDKQLEFKIEDAVSRDYKNIAVVKTVKIDETTYSAQIILQPKSKVKLDKIYEGMRKRISKTIDKNIKVYVKVRNWDDYYPLTKSLKVDKKALIDEGIQGMTDIMR